MTIASASSAQVERQQLRASLAAFNFNLSLRAVFDTACGVGGFIFVNYALSLGVAKEKMGYFTALISIACLFQMLGLALTPYIRNKKRYALTLGYLEPALMMAAVLVAPLLPPGYRLPFVALAVFMSAALFHLTKPTTDDWLSASIPGGVRGRYLGRRLQLQSLTLIVVTIASGYLAERIDRTASFQWALLIAAGGLFGVLAIRAMARASMPNISAAAHVRWGDFRDVVHNRAFLKCVTGFILVQLPFFVACPYYQVFYLRVLNLPESNIAFLTTGYYVVRILCLPLLGRWIDRAGARRVLYTTLPIYIVFFAGLALLTPACRWPLALIWMVVGIVDAAFGVASVSTLYQCVPETPSRQAYFVFFNIFLFAFTAIGSVLGVPFLEALKHRSLAIGSLTFGHFNLLFGLCAVLMIPCILAARLFPERSDRTASRAPAQA